MEIGFRLSLISVSKVRGLARGSLFCLLEYWTRIGLDQNIEGHPDLSATVLSKFLSKFVHRYLGRIRSREFVNTWIRLLSRPIVCL